MSNEGGAVTARQDSLTIEEYKKLVDQCARERLDFVIPNGSPAHARILIAKLFDTANRVVSVVSGQLVDTTSDTNEEVYGYAPLIECAQRFLHREGTRLSIILEEPINLGVNNRFLRTLISDARRRGTIVVYPNTGLVNSTETPHLTITDALAFRMEVDNSKVEAFANFGDARYARTVTELFRKLEAYVRTSTARCFEFTPGQPFVLN